MVATTRAALVFTAPAPLRLYAEIRKKTFGAGPDPQSDSAFAGAKLEIVDHERWLWRIVNEQSRGRSNDDDAQAGPDAWFEIDIRLVLFRKLLAHARPRKIRM